MIFLAPYTAQIARLSATPGNSDKENYSVINVSVPMDIQPASAELIAITEGRYGQVFKAFTTYSGIAIGDRITVSGTGDIYKVRGVDNWNRPPMPHVELVLFKGDN